MTTSPRGNSKAGWGPAIDDAGCTGSWQSLLEALPLFETPRTNCVFLGYLFNLTLNDS